MECRTPVKGVVGVGRVEKGWSREGGRGEGRGEEGEGGREERTSLWMATHAASSTTTSSSTSAMLTSKHVQKVEKNAPQRFFAIAITWPSGHSPHTHTRSHDHTITRSHDQHDGFNSNPERERTRLCRGQTQTSPTTPTMPRRPKTRLWQERGRTLIPATGVGERRRGGAPSR